MSLWTRKDSEWHSLWEGVTGRELLLVALAAVAGGVRSIEAAGLNPQAQHDVIRLLRQRERLGESVLEPACGVFGEEEVASLGGPRPALAAFFTFAGVELGDRLEGRLDAVRRVVLRDAIQRS